MTKKLFAMLLLLSLLLGLRLAGPSTAQEGDTPDQPAFEDLPAGEWTRISTGGQTSCLYGTDYAFFVRPAPAPTDKLMVYFQGGGACWDGATCGAIGRFASVYEVPEGFPASHSSGIFDFDHPQNPVADYHTVFVPYCSGDVFTGDRVVTFDVPPEAGLDSDTIEVNFRGEANTEAVLDWVYANLSGPEQVFVTGCSAGGYGATFYAPDVMANYEDSRVVHLSDAAAGVIPEGWEGLATWGTFDNLPESLALGEVGAPEMVNRILIAAGQTYPDNLLAQTNTYVDQVQVGFYGLMLGRDVLNDSGAAVLTASQWQQGLRGNLSAIDEAAPNFDYYTAGGPLHCQLPQAEFYEYAVEGVAVRDWVAALLDGESLGDVACPLSQCLQAPAAGEGE